MFDFLRKKGRRTDLQIALGTTPIDPSLFPDIVVTALREKVPTVIVVSSSLSALVVQKPGGENIQVQLDGILSQLDRSVVGDRETVLDSFIGMVVEMATLTRDHR